MTARLRSFKDHPFKVEDDKDMHLLKDSIKKYGVLNPLIIRVMNDEEAIIKMVDSNLQRERISYSEKAFVCVTGEDDEIIYV